MSIRGSKGKTTTIVIEKKNNHLVLRNSADTMLVGMVYQTLRQRLEVLESFSTEICIELSIKEKWII